MAADSTEPLDGIDYGSVAPSTVTESDVRAALSSSEPLIRQRGVKVCEALTEQTVDAVGPFLDTIASLAGGDNAPIALHAIRILDTVVETEPAALEGRVADLSKALDSSVVDVQLTAGTVLGNLVVEQPALVAPAIEQLIESVADTDPAFTSQDFTSVSDQATRKTLQEHDAAERKRRTDGRRTLINVVVAITETKPRSAFDSVDTLSTLLDDGDPAVAGGAIDALGELAAVNPTVVDPFRDRLLDCLDRDSTVIRARAIRALGHLGDDAAVPKLRTLAETASDETVRSIARKTANFLADAE